MREWVDEKCLIRVALSLPINEGGVRGPGCIIYFVHLTNPAATLGQSTTCRKQSLKDNAPPFGKQVNLFHIHLVIIIFISTKGEATHRNKDVDVALVLTVVGPHRQPENTMS